MCTCSSLGRCSTVSEATAQSSRCFCEMTSRLYMHAGEEERKIAGQRLVEALPVVEPDLVADTLEQRGAGALGLLANCRRRRSVPWQSSQRAVGSGMRSATRSLPSDSRHGPDHLTGRRTSPFRNRAHRGVMLGWRNGAPDAQSPHLSRLRRSRPHRKRHQSRRLPAGRTRLRHADPASRRPHGRCGTGQSGVVGRPQGRVHRGRARRRPRHRRHRRGHHADAVLRHGPLAAGRRRQHHGKPQPGGLQRREDGPPRRRPAQRGRDPGAAPHDRAGRLRVRPGRRDRARCARRLLRRR